MCGGFSETAAWNTSEKAIMLIGMGLPREGLLALRILKAQEVSTKGVYRPHMVSTAIDGPSRTLREPRMSAYQ